LREGAEPFKRETLRRASASVGFIAEVPELPGVMVHDRTPARFGCRLTAQIRHLGREIAAQPGNFGRGRQMRCTVAVSVA
jgi:hypothetical protein